MRAIAFALAFASSLVISLAQVSFAEMASSEKVVGIIEKSKVLGESAKLLASINGTEATISTYRHKESVDKDNDCKIDAALIAKELMVTNDLGLRRVIVHFHEPDLTGKFREVSVSYAEIKAFASGAVQQSDFLASLGLNLIPEPKAASANEHSRAEGGDSVKDPVNPVADASAGTQPFASGENKATEKFSSADLGSGKNTTGGPASALSTNSKSSAPGKVVLPRQRFTSPRCGFTFLLPYGWTLALEGKAKFSRRQPGELVFALHNPSTGYDQIECRRRTDKSSPDQCAAIIKKEFTYPGANIDKYQSISFGKGPYGGAFVLARYPNNDGEYHETHLLFGSAGLFYDLRGWGPVKDKTF